MEKFADIDAGPAPTRVLGAEAAAKLQQKAAGMVQSAERDVYVRNDTLSIRRPRT